MLSSKLPKLGIIMLRDHDPWNLEFGWSYFSWRHSLVFLPIKPFRAPLAVLLSLHSMRESGKHCQRPLHRAASSRKRFSGSLPFALWVGSKKTRSLISLAYVARPHAHLCLPCLRQDPAHLQLIIMPIGWLLVVMPIRRHLSPSPPPSLPPPSSRSSPSLLRSLRSRPQSPKPLSLPPPCAATTFLPLLLVGWEQEPSRELYQTPLGAVGSRRELEGVKAMGSGSGSELRALPKWSLNFDI